MNEKFYNDIILDKEQSEKLIRQLINPKMEIIDKREKFLEDTKTYSIEEIDGSFIIDIPNADNCFVNNKFTEEIKHLNDNIVEAEDITFINCDNSFKGYINRMSAK